MVNLIFVQMHPSKPKPDYSSVFVFVDVLAVRSKNYENNYGTAYGIAVTKVSDALQRGRVPRFP